jgi:restriction endonuclease S subunit
MVLSEKVKIMRPNTTSREFFDPENGIKCVHYGDIYKNYSGKTINSSAIINRFAQDVSVEKVLHCDSVIVPDVTETVSDWGHFVYVKYDGTPYINGTHTFAITCKSTITLRYLFRYLQASDNVKRLQTLLNGSTVFQISIANFNAFELQNYHDDEQTQRYIVDLIGTIDDKVENNEVTIAKLTQLGLVYMSDYLTDFDNVEPLLNHVKFIKGFEPGSSAYIATPMVGSKPFIRGKTLESRVYDTFIFIAADNSMPLASEHDVLIALDGAAGRTACGLNGVYSSGIRKAVNCGSQNLSNGFIYFYLNSEYVQNIIIAFSQSRTTIAHAGKAVEEMELPIRPKLEVLNDKLSTLFDKTVSIYAENEKLNALKQQYLKRYFG